MIPTTFLTSANAAILLLITTELRADVLSPITVPEPTALALLGSVLLGLGVVYLRRRGATTILRLFFAGALLASAVTAQADVFHMGGTISGGTWTGLASLSFVTVGNPGNVADPATGYGAVSYTYNIGEYDVTTGQYVAFLNSVATKSDAYGLYNSGMDASFPSVGITQTAVIGVPGISYSYSVTGTAPAAANMPVFNVSWGDAARFCNWLDNGQPTSGTEAAGTTETGAYTLSGATSSALLMSATRNAGATYFIPSEDEWYKAAYYNPSSGTYWTYPTQSNTVPNNSWSLAPTSNNDANYFLSNFTDTTTDLTPVGSFANSPGPYGTYDMGGDVWQWNEANFSGSDRGMRGGAWILNSGDLASAYRDGNSPTDEDAETGFRVASVPEPGSLALLLAGAAALAIRRLRRKA